MFTDIILDPSTNLWTNRGLKRTAMAMHYERFRKCRGCSNVANRDEFTQWFTPPTPPDGGLEDATVEDPAYLRMEVIKTNWKDIDNLRKLEKGVHQRVH